MKNAFLLLLLLLSNLVFGIQDPVYQKVKASIDDQISKEDHGIQFLITSSSLNGDVQHIYGMQAVHGIPIYGTEFNISFKQDQPIVFHHHFIVQASALCSKGLPMPAKQSLFYILGDLQLNGNWSQTSPNTYEYQDPAVSDESIKVQRMWSLQDGALIPAYTVSKYDLDHGHWYNTLINGFNGQILDQVDWVSHCEFPEHDHAQMLAPTPEIKERNTTHKVNADASYRVFAHPIESPNHGVRTIVEDPQDSTASPYGWHDVNGQTGAEFTITRGNNVYASEDKNADNVAGSSPDGGSSLIFNDTFDISQSAALFTDASVTNLFYWNNLMHDVWYHYGFDEQSGNFQSNNYGKGGSGGDFVNADAQDGSGTNNANFATPPDGQNPRMQMYIWNSGSNTGDFVQVNSPSTAAGKYNSSVSAFGATLTAIPVTGDLVITDPVRACGTIANSSALNGKIAFIERGSCTFVEKVRNAQSAGAIGVIIYDSTGNNPIFMGGTATDITIPVVMIRRIDGLFIRNLIPGGVNVSLYDSSTVGSTVFDSDFDAGIIAHEYGHGISNRLTGGPAASGCLSNQEQMGEGWSDFFALVMTHAADDQSTDIRGVGTYVTNQSTNGGGIRPFPYSTNMSISPYTYDDIKSFSVPHGVGSVWCAMLWDLYWAFIDEYGYDQDIYRGTGGNNTVMQLVIDGMKLQPCNPGFEDGRDAILLADQLNNNGENQLLIWEVFARRGLGWDADQGGSNSRSDGEEGFEIPPFFSDELIIEKRAVTEIENGQSIEYSLIARNLSGTPKYNVVLVDTLPMGLFIDEVPCASSFENRIITINLDSIAAEDSFVCSFTALVKFEETSTTIYSDDIESGQGDWEIQSDAGSNVWAIRDLRKRSGDNAWFVDDIITESDQSLILELEITGNQPVFSFYQYYGLEESWDGGVIEIGLNGQFLDAEPYFVLHPYNGVIQNNPASAISGRKAFTGSSGGFRLTKIDLSDFIDSTVAIKFRFASDGAVGGDGWYIDDVSLEDAVSLHNQLFAAYDQDKTGMAEVFTFVTGEGLELSVKEFNAHGISVYPNPFSNSIQINWPNQDYEVKLFSLNGQLLMTSKASNQSTLELSQLTAGMYILELSNEFSSHRSKLIKK